MVSVRVMRPLHDQSTNDCANTSRSTTSSVAHDLNRLSRSFAKLVGFVEELREHDVDIDLVNQRIGTVDEVGWILEMMLNMMMSLQTPNAK